MTEINETYILKKTIKGWPTRGAHNLDEASDMMFGSPYWELPTDSYRVIDKNDTYSLVAALTDGKASMQNRYMAVNMDLLENSERIS